MFMWAEFDTTMDIIFLKGLIFSVKQKQNKKERKRKLELGTWEIRALA